MDNLFKTKKDFQNCVIDLINPLKPYYNVDAAELKYGVHSSGASEKVQRTEAFIRPLWGLAPLWAGGDNMLMFEKHGYWFVRRNCTEFCVNDDASVYSKWSPFDGVTVETLIIPTEDGHIRRHTIESDGEYNAYDSTFQLPGEDGEVKSDKGEAEIIHTCPNLNLYDPRRLNMKAIKYTIPKGKSHFETKVIYPK